jgi:hypothetical protein
MNETFDASRTIAVVVATATKNHDFGFAGVGNPLRAADNLREDLLGFPVVEEWTLSNTSAYIICS